MLSVKNIPSIRERMANEWKETKVVETGYQMPLLSIYSMYYYCYTYYTSIQPLKKKNSLPG